MLSHPGIQLCLLHHAEHAQTHPHHHPPSASAVKMPAQSIGAAASLREMSTEIVMATEAGTGPEVMYTQQIGMTQQETMVMMQLLCMVTGGATAAGQRASANQRETAVEIVAELLMATGTMVTGTELGSQTGNGMVTGVVTGHSTMETGGRRGAADSETLLDAMPAQSGMMYIMSMSPTGMQMLNNQLHSGGHSMLACCSMNSSHLGSLADA